ncbi:MAG: peptidase M29 [Planktomarina sp.]
MNAIINPNWQDAFVQVFGLCKMHEDEVIVILSEQGSRPDNIALAKAALTQMGLGYFQINVPSPLGEHGPIIRSSGACLALDAHPAAVKSLTHADVILDMTVEGLMHAKQTGSLLQSGARILNIANEHPEILARLIPTPDIKDRVKDAAKRCKMAHEMTVTSAAGTDLRVDMRGASNVGVWGYTDRPGTLAHWPGGLVVSFPKAGTVNGQLVFAPGDMNLTFKRYFESTVTCTLDADYVTDIQGQGADALLMRDYYAGFNDPLAYATSHVGWGLNPAARWEAMTMYDKSDLNGTELRALAGNFLYSTGANEFAGRFTKGHFDLPMMGCDIALDGTLVVKKGQPV